MESNSPPRGETDPGFFKVDSRLFHYISMALVLCVGISLSVFLFMTTKKMEEDRIKAGFEQQAQNRFAAFKNMMNNYLQEIEASEALYAASEKVTRAEFRIFTKNLLSHYERTQAIEWIPRVPDSGRAAYETAIRREGFPDFRITEKTAEGVMVKAALRKEYFPVHFIEPFEGNEGAFGYDLASDPSRLEALSRSRDTGQVIATARVKLVQGKGEDYGFLILRPVYLKDSPADSTEARRRDLEGFVLGAFRIGDLLEDALSSFVPTGIDIYLYDQSAHVNDSFLYFHQARTRSMKVSPVSDINELTKGLHYSDALDVGGRKWLALFIPTPDYISSRMPWNAWWFLAGGVLVTGLLAGYISLVIWQAARARRYSAVLFRSKEKLEHEITERRKAEEALMKSEAVLNETQRITKVGGWEFDVREGRIFWTDEVYRIYEVPSGYDPNNVEQAMSFYSPEDLPVLKTAFERAVNNGEPYDLELQFTTATGKRLWVRTIGKAIQEYGKTVKVYGNIMDTTERKKAEEEIIRAKKEWEKTFDAIPDIVVIIDNQYRIIRANKAMAEKLGVAKEELVGKLCYKLFHRLDEPPSHCPHHKTITAGKEHLEEFYSENLETHYIISATPLFDSEGRIFGIVEIAHDISDRKRMEEQLKATAMTDELTGLLNRRGFFTLAEQQCKLSDRSGRQISLLFIDVDGFKTINDELGHEAGDQALIDTANLLRKTFRESDIIARIGGDEFVALLTDPSGPDIDDIIIRHVTNNIRVHNEQSGRNFALIFSMGVANYDPKRPCSVTELLMQADELMYKDKKRHRRERPLSPSRSENTERRAHMRHNADDKFQARLDNIEKARIKDISAGGICLMPSRQLTVNSNHELHIFPSPNGDISLKGKVVWSSGRVTDSDSHLYEAGLEFISATTSWQLIIKKPINN